MNFQIELGRLRDLIARHGERHALSGPDAARVGKTSTREVRSLKNASGAAVARGDVVVLSTAIGTDDSFTTSTTVDDPAAIGVALEGIPDTTFGLVSLSGYVEEVTVAAGVTRYQFLSPSGTAGQARGTNAPTSGTFGQALANRNATTGKVPALLQRSSGPTVLLAKRDVDKALTGNTTLQNDAALSFPIPAGQSFIFDMFLSVEGDPDGEMQMAFTVPLAAALRWGAASELLTVDASSGIRSVAYSSGTPLRMGTDTQPVAVLIRGSVVNTGTAGTVQFQWAQSISSAVPTKVHAGSWLRPERSS